MKYRFLPVLLFLILTTGAGYAQIDTVRQEAQTPPSVTKWNLKQCVDYALANSLVLQRSYYNLQSSKVDLRAAQLSRIPSVNGNASYGSSWGRGLDPVNNTYVPNQQINSSNIAAQASLPLINGLRIYNTIKQNERTYAAYEQDLAKTRNDVTLNVANLFINVVTNKELVDNAKFKLASSLQQYERSKKQVAAGALPKSEELNLDAQVATDEVTLVQNENALALSILQLKQAMQMPATDPLDVETPALEPEELVIDQTRDEIFEIARNTMPEIRSSQLKIQSAEYSARAARGNLYPRLNATSSFNTNYSSIAERTPISADLGFASTPAGYLNKDLSQPVYSYGPTSIQYANTNTFNKQFSNNIFKTLGLQLTIPIFNSYSARASLQKSIIQTRQAEVNAKEISNTLRQNVETAYNDAISAAKTYNASLRQVQAREEAFRMMNQRFTAGAANSFEFQVSQNSLYQAKSDLSRAKYNFIFKKKVLDFYQGKSIDY